MSKTKEVVSVRLSASDKMKIARRVLREVEGLSPVDARGAVGILGIVAGSPARVAVRKALALLERAELTEGELVSVVAIAAACVEGEAEMIGGAVQQLVPGSAG